MIHFVWALLWAIIVLLFTLMPLDGAAENIPLFEGADKLVHAGFFFVLSVLLFLGWARWKKTDTPSLVPFLLISLCCVLFGALIELLQHTLFTYRSGDVWDVFANTVGTGMAAFAYLLLHRNFSQIRS